MLSGAALLSAVILTIGLHVRASNESNKIFGNMTYFFDDGPSLDGKVAAKLNNGEHEEPYLNVYYENKYVYGDFNHDGLKDAAVIITENTGGNSDWYTLAFLINNGTKLVHKASVDLDDRAVINSMREKEGKVLIDMYVHGPDDSRGGPSKRVKNLYRYVNPDGLPGKKITVPFDSAQVFSF